MNEKTRAAVQDLILGAEAEKKQLTEKTKDLVDQVAKNASRLAVLEIVEGAGELIKEYADKAEETMLPFDDAIVSLIADKYLDSASKKV